MNDNIRNEITAKYKNLNPVDLSDIAKYICSMPTERAYQSWKLVKEEFTEDFPTLAKIRAFLKNKMPGDKGIVDLTAAAMRCQVCDMIYANKRDRIEGVLHCPRCGSNSMSIIPDCNPELITWAQDNCYKCPHFEQENKRGVYGPRCPSHGTGKKEPECNDCICRGCCKAFDIRPAYQRQTQEERQEEQERKDWRKVKSENIELSNKAQAGASELLKRLGIV